MKPSIHIVIPDTQTKPDVPADHLQWIGEYINEQFSSKDANITIIHLGDHWDMPSLSSYDKGKRSMEGRRIFDDVAAGNEAFNILAEPFAKLKAKRLFLTGNHEERIERAIECNPQMEGVLTLAQLKVPQKWETVPYLEPVTLEGITYSHYFYNPNTGRAYGGTSIDLRLKVMGQSFTMGHQQGLLWGRRELNNDRTHIGLVAGSCYLHDEDYRGPQANDHWRGIIVCHNVEDGEYDPMFVSLDYLCRRYTGRRLGAYVPKLIL